MTKNPPEIFMALPEDQHPQERGALNDLQEDLRKRITRKDDRTLRCKVMVGPLEITAYAFGDRIYVQSSQCSFWNSPRHWKSGVYWGEIVDVEEPFIEAEIVGDAEHRNKVVKERRDVPYSQRHRALPRERRQWGTWRGHEYVDVKKVISYSGRYDYHRRENASAKPWLFIPVRVTAGGASVTEHLAFKSPEIYGMLLQPSSGAHSVSFLGVLCGHATRHDQRVFHDQGYGNWRAYQDVLKGVAAGDVECEDIGALWDWYLTQNLGLKTTLEEQDRKGCKGLENRKAIKPLIAQLKTDDTILFKLYLHLHSGATRQSVSNNQLIATMLGQVEVYEDLKAHLQRVLDQAHEAKMPSGVDNPKTRALAMLLTGAEEKVRIKKAKTEWYERRGIESRAEGLGSDKAKYPRLWKLIAAKKIPLNIFHEPGQEKNLVNVEFDLWERALRRKGWAEVICAIAKDASRRTTYTHLISSYLVFLFRIERYLGRHTPGRKKWRAFPRFVEAQWELEMDAPTEEGTVKRRSALTPIVDNEARTIHVPYASLAISGRQITYCYSNRYEVFEEGLNDEQGHGVVTKDLEVALNGRDDYGLMYYTLTGTGRNRGYPTFLVIFERTTAHGTRVHFHRVHPNRSRDGVATPTSRLIAECYRYMAGNVRAEEITAQQGDLIFLPSENGPAKGKEEAVGVADFESHAFVPPTPGTPVTLVANQARTIKNRLGHIYSEAAFVVQHPEHEDVPLPAGWYEVRRARSWESNPMAVWSFTID